MNELDEGGDREVPAAALSSVVGRRREDEQREHHEAAPTDDIKLIKPTSVISRPPDVSTWHDYPAYVRPEPLGGMRLLHQHNCVESSSSSDDDDSCCIRVGTPTPFETEIFRGCLVLRASGLPTSEERQFEGMKRKLQLVVQGQFTQDVKYSELIAGEEFSRPFTHPPSDWLVGLFLFVARNVSPCYSLSGPTEARPGVTGLMLGLAQSVAVSEPGEEPDATGTPSEDTELLRGAGCDDFPRSFEERKRCFSGDPAAADGGWKDVVFDRSKVWTFGFWEHLMSIADFRLDLGIVSLPAAEYVEDQPLILCGRGSEKAGEKTLYSIEIWHERFVRAMNKNRGIDGINGDGNGNRRDGDGDSDGDGNGSADGNGGGWGWGWGWG